MNLETNLRTLIKQWRTFVIGITKGVSVHDTTTDLGVARYEAFMSALVKVIDLFV